MNGLIVFKHAFLFDVYQKPVTGSLEVPVLRIELYTGLLRKRCSYHYFD